MTGPFLKLPVGGDEGGGYNVNKKLWIRTVCMHMTDILNVYNIMLNGTFSPATAHMIILL